MGRPRRGKGYDTVPIQVLAMGPAALSALPVVEMILPLLSRAATGVLAATGSDVSTRHRFASGSYSFTSLRGSPNDPPLPLPPIVINRPLRTKAELLKCERGAGRLASFVHALVAGS